MEVYTLMREYYVEYEKCYEILGIFDEDHIKDAQIQAEQEYPKDSIWDECFDLNDKYCIKN